jgi:hypothetical protein
MSPPHWPGLARPRASSPAMHNQLKQHFFELRWSHRPIFVVRSNRSLRPCLVGASSPKIAPCLDCASTRPLATTTAHHHCPHALAHHRHHLHCLSDAHGPPPPSGLRLPTCMAHITRITPTSCAPHPCPCPCLDPTLARTLSRSQQ